MVRALELPNHYETEVVEISPRHTERAFNPSAVFCSLLDELKVELEDSADNEGFYHNRSQLLKAYGSNRMYGLCAYWSEEMLEHKSFDDLIFVKNKHQMIHRMLPCFLVLEEEDDIHRVRACSYLWTAHRARNKGLATFMLDCLEVRSVSDPLPQAEAFWAKHFASVQAEIDEGHRTS
jgi:hypothetical protein